ncbi:MAG TPA: LuxR C-terminal-related transcriptional regulator [Streptosporangiaceae bacterium]|jgi:LuxR family maltose regulon positive regulatory protein|nr:LuxR C-terminal-related transcriptional regulator [Streptosporangiaceae bacterium]
MNMPGGHQLGEPDTVAAAAARSVVARSALFARLTEAGRVTVLSAPAGSGKTILLRSWIAEAGLEKRAAWVPVHGEERHPQRFWISVADALRATAAGSALVRPLTAAPELNGWAIVERLLEDLHSLPERVWLVIDDLHELRSAYALRQLELLMMRAPAELRFVLASRRDPQLGLHRLRLDGELTEIRAAELRFTLDESRDLLDAAGVRLSDPALALLHDRTEGWAAGLRLAALSLAGHPDPELFAEGFSGSERTVAEYLLAEVLGRQPKQVRRLLVRTSVLERVNGELADLLTGSSGGGRILRELEQANAFVVALDAHRSWFRYHPLFADLLQLELLDTAPDEVARLHGAAAGWFAEHGFPVEAVRHAQAAQDWCLAAQVLSDHWFGLVLDGRAATADELLAGFPAGVIAAEAELIALQAARELDQGSFEAAERNLRLAAEGAASVPADRRGHLQVMLIMLRLNLARLRGDVPVLLEEARRLLEPTGTLAAAQMGLGEELRAIALLGLGTTESWTARFEEAQQHLEQARALAHRIRRPYLEFSSLVFQAIVETLRSSALAVEPSTQAIELARQHGWTEDPLAAGAYLALGAALVRQGRLEEAEPWIQRAERAVGAQPAAGLALHYVRAELELARGHDEEALAAFRAGERQAERLVAPHPLAIRLRALLLRTLLRTGATERVEQALAELDDKERETGEMRATLAALRLAQHDPRAATVALGPVIDGSAPVTNPTSVSEALLLEATARDVLGDPAAAGRALERALDLAEPDGAVLPFLLHPVAGLLERLPRHRTAHASLIWQILNLTAGEGRPPAPAGASLSLLEPLSDSETRVLRYLPTDLSAREIADELVLSWYTVKTHMRHLYAKLGTHTRHETVERARSLGLLAPSPRKLAS